MLPSLTVAAAAVKLPGEYLFGYLDSGCRVFCVGNVITPSLIPHLDRDVNPDRRLLLPRLKSSFCLAKKQLKRLRKRCNVDLAELKAAMHDTLAQLALEVVANR